MRATPAPGRGQWWLAVGSAPLGGARYNRFRPGMTSQEAPHALARTAAKAQPA